MGRITFFYILVEFHYITKEKESYSNALEDFLMKISTTSVL
jgi:hypothetical protein